MRRIAKIVAIASVFAAAGLSVAAVPAHAAQQHAVQQHAVQQHAQRHGGTCHRPVTALGISGTICISAEGNSVVARASFTADGPIIPVPVRVCVVIYNADIGFVGGTCKHVEPGTTVKATARRQAGFYVADAFILRPFWLDFGPTPALTVCTSSCPQ